jgi:ATP synthase protein I
VAATQRPDGGSRPGHNAAFGRPQPAAPLREFQRPSAHGGQAAGSSPATGGSGQGLRQSGHNEGWSVFSYLIAGMACYGGIGWLVARWTQLTFLFPVGMLVGLILGIVLILYRFGKP